MAFIFSLSNMKLSHVLVAVMATFCLVSADTATIPTTSTSSPSVPQPVYQPGDNYVPHATYPYSDTYPISGYDGYLVPAGSIQYTAPKQEDDSAVSNVPVSNCFYLHILLIVRYRFKIASK